MVKIKQKKGGFEIEIEIKIGTWEKKYWEVSKMSVKQLPTEVLASH